ncbi:MAG: dihydroxyacetone kinase subunit L [Christensenellaceae bacterium]|jgi:dihydroxyacetone kinase|nr:dihydroxyacetone kinase subunit L [Christensenellaceae bacterium]
MLTKEALQRAVAAISQKMDENKELLVALDQQNGDGDLGIYMSAGFAAVKESLSTAEEADLGRLLLKCASVFNEAAPSSLGTILSFGYMGMARALRGKAEASLPDVTAALEAGVNNIMEKAKSKPGEKTVLDALCPAVEALKQAAGQSAAEAFALAAKAAAEGSEATKAMVPKHGRAAYYGEKGLGLLDGGSVAGKLIFEGIAQACEGK